MKVDNVVIGKRVTLGAAINGIAAVLAHFYPEHAQAVITAAIPVTFAVQILVANKFGITQ